MKRVLIQFGVSLAMFALPTVALAQSADFSAAALRSLLALVVVLAIIMGIAYFVRNFGQSRLAGRAADHPIRVVGQRALGARQKLVLVEIDGCRVLLGISQGGIRTLHRGCDDGDSGISEQEPNQ